MTDSEIKINEAIPEANVENKKINSLKETIFENKDVLNNKFSTATILQIVISLYPTDKSEFKDKIFGTKKKNLYNSLNDLWTLTHKDTKFHDEMWNTPPKKVRGGENGKKKIKDLTFTMKVRTIRFSLKFLRNKVKWFQFNTYMNDKELDNYRKNLVIKFNSTIKNIDEFAPIKPKTSKDHSKTNENLSNISELIQATQPAFISTYEMNEKTDDNSITITIKANADQVSKLLRVLQSDH